MPFPQEKEIISLAHTAPPALAPQLTMLMMATVSKLPTVTTTRESLSRGCVSTLSEMAWSVLRAGRHLCGAKTCKAAAETRDSLTQERQ